jgi:hypothetical protein
VGKAEAAGEDFSDWQCWRKAEMAELTQEQIEAFAELDRLLSGARRSATLSFPKNDARLHSEFHVASHTPSDFPSEIDRAGKVLAACQAHAAALDDHGWLDEDTNGLIRQYFPKRTNFEKITEE